MIITLQLRKLTLRGQGDCGDMVRACKTVYLLLDRPGKFVSDQYPHYHRRALSAQYFHHLCMQAPFKIHKIDVCPKSSYQS